MIIDDELSANRKIAEQQYYNLKAEYFRIKETGDYVEGYLFDLLKEKLSETEYQLKLIKDDYKILNERYIELENEVRK